MVELGRPLHILDFRALTSEPEVEPEVFQKLNSNHSLPLVFANSKNLRVFLVTEDKVQLMIIPLNEPFVTDFWSRWRRKRTRRRKSSSSSSSSSSFCSTWIRSNCHRGFRTPSGGRGSFNRNCTPQPKRPDASTSLARTSKIGNIKSISSGSPSALVSRADV